MPYFMSDESIAANEEAIRELSKQMSPAAVILAEQMVAEDERNNPPVRKTRGDGGYWFWDD